ncbi:conserved protein of unknown function [Candidatus Filomicrobium marinum]|nr:conserved protein of unknown function [Candidatus Filomicrobium marinum]
MGGGALLPLRSHDVRTGRSPRGRRSPTAYDFPVRMLGSISAWAEEPGYRLARLFGRGVDLRVGGGAFLVVAEIARPWGRSPRGRRSR